MGSADASYRGPFRFVELPDQVVLAPDAVRVPRYETPLDNGFTGKVEVEWAAETPLLVGAEGKDATGSLAVPMRLGDRGPYFIPGTTLKGMLRATMEIICRGRLAQLNAHHRYGLRDFTHPWYAEGRGVGDANPLAWDNIQAGWLRITDNVALPDGDRGSAYVIEPCDKAMVRIKELPKSFGNIAKDNAWRAIWLKTKLTRRYELADMFKDGIIDFTKQTGFRRIDSDYVEPDPSGDLDGVFVFSGHSPTAANKTKEDLDEEEAAGNPGQQKKREYVFIERANTQAVRLTQHAFDRFELINSKPAKNRRKPDGSWAILKPTVDAGFRIPIFYTGNLKGDQADLEIGLTRLFKVGHRFTVGDVLAHQKQHRIDMHRPDMVEALFGYVYETDDAGVVQRASTAPGEVARKGRAAFGFAKLINVISDVRESDVVNAVMMGPRASYAPFYLRGNHKDWSDGDARLAGRKRYFPRYPGRDALVGSGDAIKAWLAKTNTGRESADMKSRIRFLEPASKGGELTFRGTIRLHNVLAEEVGALLWALTHGGAPRKPYRYLIGRAKPAGAGQLRVKSIRLALEGHKNISELRQPPNADWELADATSGHEGWVPNGGQSLAPFLDAFHSYMESHVTGWPNTDEILELLGASDPMNGAAIAAGTLDHYPALEVFREIRDTTKLDKRLRSPRKGAPSRYLPAHRMTGPIETPYRRVQ